MTAIGPRSGFLYQSHPNELDCGCGALHTTWWALSSSIPHFLQSGWVTILRAWRCFYWRYRLHDYFEFSSRRASFLLFCILWYLNAFFRLVCLGHRCFSISIRYSLFLFQPIRCIIVYYKHRTAKRTAWTPNIRGIIFAGVPGFGWNKGRGIIFLMNWWNLGEILYNERGRVELMMSCCGWGVIMN